MTIDLQALSLEQEAALAPEIRLIEAGPGAGKTKTVVSRFRANAATGRGVALLSFTNAAVNVAKKRCQDNPTLAEPPHFIGTFDQFFHRYVVTPALRKSQGKSPSYVTSWADLPQRISTARSADGKARIRLTAFTQQNNGTWRVDPVLLRDSDGHTWNNIGAVARNQINTSATAILNGLIKAGVLDATCARRQALTVLELADNPYLQRLARRFTEVIVDEFQDCDEDEHKLLNILTHAGIHVVAVADPDQAIYEFRQQSEGLYERYRESLASQEIAALTTCYRSSAAICALATSLRKVGSDPINAHPDHRQGAEHVHVVVGSGVDAGSQALTIARSMGVNPRNTRIVAHQKSDARSLLRAGKEAPQGVSNMRSVLVPLAQLRSSSDTRERLTACRTIEGFILSHYDWPEEPATRTRAEQLDQLGINHMDIRLITHQLLRSSHNWGTSADCKTSVKQHVMDFASNHPVPLLPRLASRLLIPSSLWTFWETRTAGLFAASDNQRTQWSHVHGIKGEEFHAVVYAIPPRQKPNQPHVLDDWANDHNSEQRRVLYVGVSRAERLLILIVSKSRLAQLIERLEAAEVPHIINEVVNESKANQAVGTQQPL